MGIGLTTRTYTPMQWDADAGATRLLAFAHADAPGSRWTVGLRQGDSCQLFGPRRSLDLSGIDSQVVLFGDETSLGLAAALRSTLPRHGYRLLFEVSDVAEPQAVLAAIDMTQARLIERLPDDAHPAEIGGQLTQYGVGARHFVLTGKGLLDPACESRPEGGRRSAVTNQGESLLGPRQGRIGLTRSPGCRRLPRMAAGADPDRRGACAVCFEARRPRLTGPEQRYVLRPGRWPRR